MKIKVKRIEHKRRDHGGGIYEFERIRVNLPDHDCDLDIRLPNGEQYVFQHRIEGPSVDICIGRKTKESSGPLAKACYLIMADLSPGKKRKGLGKAARMAEQITIV